VHEEYFGFVGNENLGNVVAGPSYQVSLISVLLEYCWK